MPLGREGNRRSGVALAMHHRLVVYPPTGSRPRQGDEHPSYALLWSMAHLPSVGSLQLGPNLYLMLLFE